MALSANLLHRLPKPALNRGRIQQAARRVLLALGGEATTRDVVEWGYCRKLMRGRRLWKADYQIARRALARIAFPVGRAGGMGRPILWKLKEKD
jgi:hypothetical protein